MKTPISARRIVGGFAFWIVAVALWLTAAAPAYMVPYAENLEKLSEDADIIFKATVTSDSAVEDAWFKPVHGFVPRETHFKVVTVVKGEYPEPALRFRHYAPAPPDKNGGFGRMYTPQYYEFNQGRTYVVFAKKTEKPGIYRQLRPHHTSKMDLGVLRCLDERPAAPGKLKALYWSELQALLKSPAAEDQIYAALQLDEMSDLPDERSSTKDFERNDVLKAVGLLMSSANEKVATGALRVVGSNNPYLRDDNAQFWLATMASVEVPGIGTRNPKMRNLGGEMYWNELMAIVDGKASAPVRSLAVRCLGLARIPESENAVKQWLVDREHGVRASATLLIADFPNGELPQQLAAMATDSSPGVRVCAAHTIGFMQLAKHAGTLGAMLKDPDSNVRRAASLSLLSFSPKHAGIAKAFRDNLDNEEFSPLFLNELAREKIEDYLEPIAKVVEQQTTPKNWPGGQIPSYTAFNILFKYLQRQSAEALRQGKFDRYLNAIEKGYSTGSTEPRDIYAFYLQRGMTERAKAYRAAAKKAASYDMDYFFNQVDANPSLYTRQGY